MQRCRVPVIRPDLHDVAYVDHEGITTWLDQRPGTLMKQLEARLLIL